MFLYFWNARDSISKLSRVVFEADTLAPLFQSRVHTAIRAGHNICIR